MERKRFFGAIGCVIIFLIGLRPTALAEDGPSLLVEKKLSQTTVRPGDTLRTTIVVRNTGGTMARDVRVTDMLPDGITFGTGSSERVWTFGDLAPGTETEQAYDAAVAADATTGETTTTITASSPDATDATQTVIIRITDALPKTGANGYTLFIIAIFGFSIMALAAFGFASAARLPSLTTEDCATYRTSEPMNSLLKQTSALIVVLFVVFNPIAAGATVTHPPTSFELTSAHLLATASVNRPSIRVGETTSIVFHITNDSDANAANVSLSLTLPSGWSFPDVTSRERLYRVADVLFARGEATWTVDVTADEDATIGNQTIAALVAADDVEAVVTTVTLTVSPAEIASADLSLTLSIKQPFANPGDTVLLRVTVENTGSAPANNAILSLDLPDGLTFSENDESGIERTFNAVAVGARTTIEFPIVIADDLTPGPRTILASLQTDRTDPIEESADLDVRAVTVLAETTEEEEEEAPTLPETGVGLLGQLTFLSGLFLLVLSGIGLGRTRRIRGAV